MDISSATEEALRSDSRLTDFFYGRGLGSECTPAFRMLSNQTGTRQAKAIRSFSRRVAADPIELRDLLLLQSIHNERAFLQNVQKNLHCWKTGT